MSVKFEGEDLLYNLAYECEGLFDQLQESFHKTQSEVATVELWAEFQQRFAVWAAHLGVFARKTQCLDTRLQNHPDLQDLVARLLDILRRSLQQCTIDTSSHRKGDAIPTAALKAIDDTLTRLNRLGVTIRQAGRGKFDARAKKFAASLDLSSFAFLCANAVQALYPGAHKSLRDYLSKSMADRYAKMLFLGSRHKRLETRRELRIGLSPIHEIPKKETQDSAAIIQLAMMTTNPVVANLSRPPPALSQSDLSSVNVHQIRNRLRPPDEASTKFHKTSSIQVNQGNYPRPPVTNQGSSIFNCQWCSELLSKKTLSESEWRRHIDRDLKPYVCLSEGCSEAHPAYPTFDEWYNHMELHDWRWHQQVYLTTSWVCTVCEFNRDVYGSPQALYSHLEESHSSEFTNAQLQAISRQSKTEQPRSSNDCLLCCFAVEEQGNSDEALFPKRRKAQPKQGASKSARKTLEMTHPNPHSPDLEFSDTSSDSDDTDSRQHRRQRNKDRSKAITRHIAVHLQVLMLLTLRFAAALQDDDGDFDDGTKSDSVDIDEGNSASIGTDLGRLSHIASEADVTMKDGQDGNDAENMDGAMELDEDVDSNIADEDIPVPDTELDLNFIPRQYDDLLVKDDKFLSNVIESGAYQSWQDEPPELVITSPPPGLDPVLEASDRYYRESMIAQKMISDEKLFRKNSPDESVVDKWQRPSTDEVVAIVSPPNEKVEEEYKSPYDPPNADVMIDNEIFPHETERFRSTETADTSRFKSRDPSCERDRPMLNLVHPTPVPSPVSMSNPMLHKDTAKVERILLSMDAMIIDHLKQFPYLAPLTFPAIDRYREALISFQRELHAFRQSRAINAIDILRYRLLFSLDSELRDALSSYSVTSSDSHLEDFCHNIAALERRLAAIKSNALKEATTAPFSQPEIEARSHGAGVNEPGDPADPEAIPLDLLQVEDDHYKQGIRILIRSLLKPSSLLLGSGSDEYQWLTLRANGASSDNPGHKVLAITQTHKDIKFTLRIPGSAEDNLSRPPLWCELYYDPASDNIVLLNRSEVPISLGRVSHATSSPPLNEHQVVAPGLAKALSPDTYRINVGDIAVLDYRILGKRPVSVYSKPISSTSRLSSRDENSEKAAETEEDFSPRLKRVGHVEFDKIAKTGAETNKRPPVPPPTVAAVEDDDANVKKLADGVRRTTFDEMTSHEETTRRQPRPVRNKVHVQGSLEEDEDEAMRQRLAARLGPRRQATAGQERGRHRVLYEDGVYRWE